MGDRRALLARQCSSDVDLRKRAPPTETHFCVGAFERAAQSQLTRGGSGLDISTVSPSQSERLPSSVLDLTGAAARGESLSPPRRHSILQRIQPMASALRRLTNGE